MRISFRSLFFSSVVLSFLTVGLQAQERSKKSASTEGIRAIPQLPAAQPVPARAKDTLTASLYKLALRYGDAIVARMAVYMELAKAPNDIALKDSLASLYAISGASLQTNLVARDVLVSQPANKKMLELQALSEQSLGRPKEALEAYEKLYPLTQNLYHLFQIASLQYNLKRLGECNLSINAIVNNPESEKQKVGLALSQTQQQEVSLKAAALNIRGVVLKDQKENAAAKAAFEEALKVQADFVLAKNNLAEMQKEAGAPKK